MCPAEAATQEQDERASTATFLYDEWMNTRGVPVHRGYYIPDVRTLEVAEWKERGAAAAFIQLDGQEGVSEARITEIPPGGEVPAYRFAIDDIVYVVSGSGLALVGTGEDLTTSFEWGPHALFMIPRHTLRAFRNLRGDRPARLLHYNHLPLVMSLLPDVDLLVNGPPLPGVDLPNLNAAMSEAEAVSGGTGLKWIGNRDTLYWHGNYFPDMAKWDRLADNSGRGAGSTSVTIQFRDSDMSCHMSQFAPGTYKKAHRHGPGRVIIIPSGEGYSVMWKEGGERVVCPWQEGSIVVPPNRWFHQHFNVGAEAARYLAFHPPLQLHGYADNVQDRAKDQIEYPDEDTWIREKFETELASRALESTMPDEAYSDRKYEWK